MLITSWTYFTIASSFTAICISAELTTNGTEFMFALPLLFGSTWQIGLHVMSFHPKNLLITRFFMETTYIQQDNHQLTSTEAYIRLGANYDTLLDDGNKPTIHIVATEPVHIVLLLVNYVHSAMTKLLPTQVWGAVYFAVTLKMNPTILITSSEDNNEVQAQLIVSDPFKVHLAGQIINKTHRFVKFYLNRVQSYSISDCKKTATQDVGALIGSKIIANYAVGVLTGSCFSRSTAYRCNSKKLTHSSHSDMLLEYGFPKKYFGTEFITYVTNVLQPDSKAPNGEVIIVASEAQTKVHLGSNTTHSLNLRYEGSWTNVLNTAAQVIRTTKPTLVYLVTWGHCDGELTNFNSPSMTVLIPMELLNNFYMMRLVKKRPGTTLKFIVVYDTSRQETFVDDTGSEVRPSSQVTVVGKDGWVVGYMPVKSELSTLRLKTWSSFGCYIIHISKTSSSLTYVDFRASEINHFTNDFTKAPRTTTTTTTPTTTTTKAVTTPPTSTRQPVPETMHPQPATLTPAPVSTEKPVTCVVSSMVNPNDTLDNDCDGAVDEEALDGIDNDKDGLTDEDAYVIAVNGGWAQWEEWLCTENCSDTHMSRRRLCDDPEPAYGGQECSGTDLEFQPGECYKNNKTCPTDCAINTWYEGCTRTCISCEGDCNKFNGSCMTCAAGYRNPKRGCKQTCDSYTYGPGCSLSCKEKCGTICAEPVYGDCPEVSLTPMLLMLLFVIVPCSILVCMPKNKKGHKDVGSEYDHTATRTSRFISTTETFSSGSDSYSNSSSSSVRVPPTRRGTRVVEAGDVAAGEGGSGGGGAGGSRGEEDLMDELQRTLFASLFPTRSRRESVLQAQYSQYHHNRHYHIGHARRHHKHRRKEDQGSTVDPTEERDGSLKSPQESVEENN